MPPEEPHAIINGQDTPLHPAAPPQPIRPNRFAFAVKYVLLVILCYVLLGIAYPIIFVGLFPISIVLVALALLLIKEMYSDFRKQLAESGPSYTPALLTLGTFLLPIVGPAGIVLYVIAKNK